MDELDKLIQALLAVNPTQPITYEVAAGYFKDKLALTAKDYYALDKRYREMAFTVSGYSSLKILQKFQDELTAAIENGTSMNEFRQTMNDFLSRNGYDELHPLQVENIFRTNIQTAYNVGAYEEMTDPTAMRLRPYWRYEAVEDERTRPAHLAMNGKVFPADNPVWDIWYPPNGYKCRCSVTSLSRREVDAQGITVEDELPDRLPYDIGYVSPRPPHGFDNNPAKVKFEPDMADMPETLRAAFQRRQGEFDGDRK